jgi:hypothetical protein
LPFEPGKIPATLGVVSMTTPAFPLGYSYQKDFQLPGNKNKKIAIKSDSKEWNFYFRQANDNSSQPRFRIWIENSVKIPIWGNLQLGPGFRHVCVPEQAGHAWKSSWHSTIRSQWKETPGKRGLSINGEELQIHEYRERLLLR